VPPQPVPSLHVQVLDGFEVTFGDDPVRVRGSGQRLLALLVVAHRGRWTGRTAVAERLWPDVPAERAASNLRSTLWRLPRPRGRQLVICTATRLRLPDDLSVDLWETEARARELNVGVPRRPDDALADLDALHGDLLPGWDDEWLLVERESHRQRRLHALEQTSRALRERGEFTDALAAALGAVRSEPLRESAHRRVIEVHLDEGNHAEALRQYEHYRRLLADELGLPPTPAIRRLVAPLLGRPVDSREPA